MSFHGGFEIEPEQNKEQITKKEKSSTFKWKFSAFWGSIEIEGDKPFFL